MKRFHQAFIAILLLISQTLSAQFYSFEKTPEWVVPIEIPNNSSVSIYDVKSGYYLALADYQIQTEKEAFFTHEVIKVVTYSGITEASQLSVSFDTNYQALQIHHLFIWRKGVKIDRTHYLSFEIINNEENLQQGIYTGQIKAYDILNDIRKDDLIDFSYTLVGDNPIFNKEKNYIIPLEMLNPADLISVRIIYPVEKDYLYKCFDCDSISFSSNVTDNFNIIEIKNENAESIVLEDFMPTWAFPFKFFNMSSMHSWIEVNTWAQEIFSVNTETGIDSVFSEIFTGNESTESKINKIIDFVQDDIRYMGIESGIGSIKPFPPEQVVKQRFGDCKDKSLLLVTLLKGIGIEKAYPVLVNSYLQQEVGQLFPSNEVFDHAIVRFDYNDTTYWVDPSIAQQGGDFRDLFTFDYGKVLIVGLPSDSLQNMLIGNVKSSADIIDEFTMYSFAEPAKLLTTSKRSGFEADIRRNMMQYYTTKDITDGVTEDLKLIFPMVNKAGETEISDNIDSNIFTVVYHFEVDGFWEEKDVSTEEAPFGFRVFRFEPVFLYQYLKLAACGERKYDFSLNHPTNLNYRVVFHFPEKLLLDDDMDIFENDAFYYEEKVEQLSSNSLQIDYKLNTKSKSIKAADYNEICNQMNTISKGLPVVIYFLK